MVSWRLLKNSDKIPEDIKKNLSLKCRCGADFILSDNLKHRRCIRADCPVHMAYKCEDIIRFFKISGIAAETCYGIVKRNKFKNPLEIVPIIFKEKKPEIRLWQVAKLSFIEGIDDEWAKILRHGFNKVDDKYAQYIPKIRENMKYFTVTDIVNENAKIVNIAVHEDLSGYKTREQYIEILNKASGGVINFILKTSVTYDTDYLVTEQKNDLGCKKIKTAIERRKPIVTPTELLESLLEKKIWRSY